MTDCRNCGREIKGNSDADICKLCQFELDEQQQLSACIEASDTKPGPETPYELSAPTNSCGTCQTEIGSDGFCLICSSHQQECTCGAVNFYFPEEYISVENEPKKFKMKFTCARCKKVNYFCPECMSRLQASADQCDQCQTIILNDYFFDLLARDVLVDWHSEVKYFNEAMELSSGDLDSLNTSLMLSWRFNFLQSQYDYEEYVVEFEGSKDVKRILNYESELRYQPFSILIKATKRARELEEEFQNDCESYVKKHDKSRSEISRGDFGGIVGGLIGTSFANSSIKSNVNQYLGKLITHLERVLSLQISCLRYEELTIFGMCSKISSHFQVSIESIIEEIMEDNKNTIDKQVIERYKTQFMRTLNFIALDKRDEYERKFKPVWF